MRILNLTVLFLTVAVGVGALYFSEVFDFSADENEMVVSSERCPVAAQDQKLVVDPILISSDTQVQVEESVPDSVSTENVEAVKIPEQKQIMQVEKVPVAQAKPRKDGDGKVKIVQKKDEVKEEQAQSSMKTLPIEDNFRPKAHHVPGTLGYKHWTGWYYPTKFVLTINDMPVITFDGKEFTRPTKELTFDPNQPLKAHFVWEFLHGRRAGWRSTEFELNPEAKSIFVGFNWKDQWQVIIDQAAPIESSDRSSDNKNVDKK